MANFPPKGDPVKPRAYASIASPALIQKNNFKFKSLSEWSYNIALGCKHGCTFCYVPNTSTIKQEINLENNDGLIPDEWVKERIAGKHWGDHHWGEYSFLRTWDEKKFRASLNSAQKAMLAGKLSPDGNAAIMFCTTTDPYQTFPGSNSKALEEKRNELVRSALKLILDESDLKVRILTRSPLAQKDFDLYEEFAKRDRILFGMSLPTFDDTLSSIYEPNAPMSLKKFETLKLAVSKGIPVYVALAPTLPDEGEAELKKTLERISTLKPVTIFHEPINLRAENLSRIELKAASKGKKIRSDVFKTKARWREYAFNQCALVDKIAKELGIPEGVLHQWPDKALASKASFMAMKRMQSEREFKTPFLSKKQKAAAEDQWENQFKPWIDYWHDPSKRISAWPPRVSKWK